MNLFVALRKPDGSELACFARVKSNSSAVELITPPLDDVILPGVTRDSILQLARDHASGKNKIAGLPDKFEVSERKLVMQDLVDAEKNGSLVEVFGAGTAAVISAVDKIGYQGRDIEIPCGPPGQGMGEIAKGFLDRMAAIQNGEIEHPWSIVAGEAKPYA